MAARKRKKTVRLNFKDAKSNRVPEGEYPAKVTSAEIATSKSSGEDYIAWQFEVSDGEHEGKVLYLNTSLQPQALFRVRELLECFGTEVPEGAMDLDPEDYIGCEAELSVTEDEYEGRRQSKVTDYAPLRKKSRRKKDEDEDEPKSKRSRKDKDEEEEVETRRGKKAKKGIERASVEDMDEDELQDLVDEHELEVDLRRLKTRKKQAAAVIEALEDANLLEEEQD